MKIDSLDHVVFTVKDIDTTCKFYAKVLGMEIVAFGENRKLCPLDRRRSTCNNSDARVL